VPGEEKFIGKGVSYCATCDAAFFKNKRVAVLGGSNSALTAALLLSEYASEVLIIYRRDKFYKAEPSWIELVNNEPKIKKIFNEEVIEICGNKNIEFVKLKSKEKLEIDGLFIEIGSEPNLNLLSDLEINTEKGYIIVDENQQISLDFILQEI
jgi:thioredoxin reductase (NADPH)